MTATDNPKGISGTLKSMKDSINKLDRRLKYGLLAGCGCVLAPIMFFVLLLISAAIFDQTEYGKKLSAEEEAKWKADAPRRNAENNLANAYRNGYKCGKEAVSKAKELQDDGFTKRAQEGLATATALFLSAAAKLPQNERSAAESGYEDAISGKESKY
jgi:hypothetical protein